LSSCGLRIRARCENVDIDGPGATEHKRGRQRAYDEDLRASCSGWYSTLGCRETGRGNSTGTHPHRIQTGPTPIPSWPPFDLVHSPSTAKRRPLRGHPPKFHRTISQRHKPGSRRLPTILATFCHPLIALAGLTRSSIMLPHSESAKPDQLGLELTKMDHCHIQSGLIADISIGGRRG
jgi:hypothetical protein